MDSAGSGCSLLWPCNSRFTGTTVIGVGSWGAILDQPKNREPEALMAPKPYGEMLRFNGPFVD